MHVYFPLITNLNSRRENGLFSSFVWQTSQLSDILESDATDEFLISVNASKKNKV